MIVRRALLALALVVTLGAAACGDGDRKAPGATAPTAQAASPSPSAPPEPFTFEIGPAAGAKNLPISAEIDTRVTGGKITSVTLVDDKGKAVVGELRADGSSWVPAQPLEHNRTYNAS